MPFDGARADEQAPADLRIRQSVADEARDLVLLCRELIARLVQAAVSRSRESLADASAVDLTRNPIGLAHALRAISDDQEVLEVANRATQHLYIVNPIKSFEERSKSLWDTHPPIGERIRALENIAGQMGTPPVPPAP